MWSIEDDLQRSVLSFPIGMQRLSSVAGWPHHLDPPTRLSGLWLHVDFFVFDIPAVLFSTVPDVNSVFSCLQHCGWKLIFLRNGF